MRWISEPDKGHADAVNKGFRMARGEIIGWLNSDDVYVDRSTILAVVEAFQKYQDVDVVYGDIIFIGEDNTILRVQCVPSFSYHRLLQWCFLEQPAVFFRRKVVETHQLDVQVKFAIDYEYWLRIGKKYYFYHLPRILAADRNHKKRISIARAEDLRKESEQLRRQYGQTYGLKYTVTRGVDMLLSGMPRRVKGLMVLATLRKQRNWTFQPKWDSWGRTLRRQVLGWNLETYLSEAN